jgi:hypothetical protein
MMGIHAARSVPECASPLALSHGRWHGCSRLKCARPFTCAHGTKAAEGRRTPGRFARFGVLVFAWTFLLSSSVQAHAPDTSYLRAVVSKHALELRFTFDLATLYRIERLDADNDGKVTRAEAEKVAPDIAEFLRRSIVLEVNEKKTELGELQHLGWPVDAGELVEEKNYGQTLVNFTFKQQTPRKVIEDFYVLYEVFAQLGAVHRVVANIEQDEKHLEVVFTQFEPDFLYDTYWTQSKELTATSQGVVDRKGHFRRGAAGVWSIRWLPMAVVLAYIFTLRWSDRRCCKWLLGLAFWFWLFVFGTDSNPTPERGATTVGAVAAWWLLALVLWPVRMVAQGLWRASKKQKQVESRTQSS